MEDAINLEELSQMKLKFDVSRPFALSLVRFASHRFFFLAPSRCRVSLITYFVKWNVDCYNVKGSDE